MTTTVHWCAGTRASRVADAEGSATAAFAPGFVEKPFAFATDKNITQINCTISHPSIWGGQPTDIHRNLL